MDVFLQREEGGMVYFKMLAVMNDLHFKRSEK